MNSGIFRECGTRPVLQPLEMMERFILGAGKGLIMEFQRMESCNFKGLFQESRSLLPCSVQTGRCMPDRMMEISIFFPELRNLPPKVGAGWEEIRNIPPNNLPN